MLCVVRRSRPGLRVETLLMRRRRKSSVNAEEPDTDENHQNRRVQILALKEARTVGEMEERVAALGVIEDPRTLTNVMVKMRKLGQKKRAYGVFEEARKRGVELDRIAFNAAITTCGWNWRRALDLFDEMRRRNIEPDSYTYNSLLSACSKHPERAFEYFEDMQRSGIQPDVYTYNILMSACTDEASALFDRMRRDGVRPDLYTYNTLISACSDPLDLFTDMQRSGIQPDLYTYKTLIARLDLFDDMRKRPDHALLYQAAIEAAIEASDWQRAFEFFDHMCQQGLGSDRVVDALDALNISARSAESLPGVLYVHDLSVPVARTAVRLALRSSATLTVVLSPDDKNGSCCQLLKSAILAMFQDDVSVSCLEPPDDPGRLHLHHVLQQHLLL